MPKLLIVKKGAGAKQKFFVNQGAGAKQYCMCLIVKNCKIDNGQIILVNLFSIWLWKYFCKGKVMFKDIVHLINSILNVICKIAKLLKQCCSKDIYMYDIEYYKNNITNGI